VNPKRQTRAQLLAEITDLRNRLAEREMVDAKQTRLECELAERTEELEERIKELNCLYAISRLLEQKRLSVDEILGKTVEIIPKTLMFDGRRCARILLDGRTFETINFFESPRRQSCPIVVSGDRKGLIEIRYLREDDSLNKEKQLLAAIAELLERIIEQKQTEKSLVESEMRFRSLVENSPTGIFILQDGSIIYENREEKRLSGPLASLFDQGNLENIHIEDLDKVRKGYEDIVSGKVANLDLDFRFYQMRDDESDIDLTWVICRASRIEYLGKKAILVNKLDVTRSKELEHLLRVEDKMASLGRIASGMAHEIRNPLSGINIYVNNMKKVLAHGGSPEKAEAILMQIQAASDKIESVVMRVMDFARPGAPKTVMTDLNRLIEETIEISALAWDKTGIVLDQRLQRDLPPCPVDPHLIGRVILNLITNAAEAMKKLKTEKRMEVASAVTDKHVIIKISDCGPGIPMYLRKKIFDPFYTTKEGGTGIGLSLSQRIISDHGGLLSVATSKWGGSEFSIELPLQKGEDGNAYIHN
jgi:PAS domain S-box-containing protein